ncbi:hypothetical protein Acsp03_37260 [Actinomadura sp. NBRC 104412]|uniref:hypothetical protein n=1 Tax=Actinomadura sp. NBRC 104412 TaxID=3032203 RepID=UPI0024A3DAA5|nr:hypothetical protein [Actinomadura sp. NBRC 104412]GLZ06260.1 hypothetical protein Acsp03_37260 [Actinomadura sp. NBRC 104412]
MTDRNVRRHAARMADRLEPGEHLTKVESVTGPLKDGAVPDGPVVGAADTIAKRFRNEVQREQPWLLCVTDRRLLFTWITARPIDRTVPLDDVLGLERLGRRGLGVRFSIHLRDGSHLDFAATKKAFSRLSDALGGFPAG